MTQNFGLDLGLLAHDLDFIASHNNLHMTSNRLTFVFFQTLKSTCLRTLVGDCFHITAFAAGKKYVEISGQPNKVTLQGESLGPEIR